MAPRNTPAMPRSTTYVTTGRRHYPDNVWAPITAAPILLPTSNNICPAPHPESLGKYQPAQPDNQSKPAPAIPGYIIVCMSASTAIA